MNPCCAGWVRSPNRSTANVSAFVPSYSDHRPWRSNQMLRASELLPAQTLHRLTSNTPSCLAGAVADISTRRKERGHVPNWTASDDSGGGGLAGAGRSPPRRGQGNGVRLAVQRQGPQGLGRQGQG